jgi:hypothetical protein
MAKRATAKAADGTRRKAATRARPSGSGSGRSTGGGSRSSGSRQRSSKRDPVDSLIKLLQSPLVLELLAVGATAALAAITQQRSSRAQGGDASGRAMKAAGKAAAAAVGQRLASEFQDIRNASGAATKSRKR